MIEHTHYLQQRLFLLRPLLALFYQGWHTLSYKVYPGMLSSIPYKSKHRPGKGKKIIKKFIVTLKMQMSTAQDYRIVLLSTIELIPKWQPIYCSFIFTVC